MTESAVPPTELSRPIALTVMRGAMRLLSATAPGVASRVAAAQPREWAMIACGAVMLSATARIAHAKWGSDDREPGDAP